MQYQIGRDGQTLGQFNEHEIRAGLFDGHYKPTDLAWCEGMTDWKPLGEIFPVVAPPVPIRSVETYSGARGHNAGIAIAALVLGILALVTCGFLGIFAIPAIVCGHMALGRIKHSHGALGGRGMAMGGLVMGYLSLVLMVMALGASLALPVFRKISDSASLASSTRRAGALMTACNIYATDHDGAFPPSLETLESGGLIADSKFLRDPLLKDDTKIGYEYSGAGMNDSTAPDAIVLISKGTDASGKRVIARKDGTVTAEIPTTQER